MKNLVLIILGMALAQTSSANTSSPNVFSTEVEGGSRCTAHRVEQTTCETPSDLEFFRKQAREQSIKICHMLLGPGALVNNEKDLGIKHVGMSKRGDEFYFGYQVTCSTSYDKIDSLVEQIVRTFDAPASLGEQEAFNALNKIGAVGVPSVAKKYPWRTTRAQENLLSYFQSQNAYEDQDVRETVFDTYASKFHRKTFDLEDELVRFYKKASNISDSEVVRMLDAGQKGILNEQYKDLLKTVALILGNQLQNGLELTHLSKEKTITLLKEFAFHGPTVDLQENQNASKLQNSISELWIGLGSNSVEILSEIMSDNSLDKTRRTLAARHLARWSDKHYKELPIETAVSLLQFNDKLVRYEVVSRFFAADENLQNELGDLLPTAVEGLLDTIENTRGALPGSTANAALFAAEILADLGSSLQNYEDKLRALFNKSVEKEEYAYTGILALTLAKALKSQGSNTHLDLIEKFEELRQIYFSDENRLPNGMAKMDTRTAVRLDKAALILKGELDDYED